MRHRIPILVLTLILGLTLAAHHATNAAAVKIPAPLIDEPLARVAEERIAILAGGCFWGVEAVFEHVRGVRDVQSGYSGGTASTARYDLVSRGGTRHAESVRIVYDASQISYGQLLKVFFSVAHNPTELNRQGPDVGPQYRSAVFAASGEHKRIAESYIEQLNRAKTFKHRIVTQVVQSDEFYEAEDYHQDFVVHNPDHPYIVYHDLPKLVDLRKEFPDLYVNRQATRP